MKELQVSLMIVTQEKMGLQEEKQRLEDFMKLSAEHEAPLKEELREKGNLIEELRLKYERITTTHSIEVAQMAAQIQELQSQLNHSGFELMEEPGSFDTEGGGDTQRSDFVDSSSEVPPCPLALPLPHLRRYARMRLSTAAPWSLFASYSILVRQLRARRQGTFLRLRQCLRKASQARPTSISAMRLGQKMRWITCRERRNFWQLAVRM